MKRTIIRLTEKDIHNMITEAVDEVIKQQFSSAATSVNKNKLPSGFKYFGGTAINKDTKKPKYNGEPAFGRGKINVDIGGGKFNNAHEYMNSNFGAINLVFDPFNRDSDWNSNVIDRVDANGGADSVTCFNCLNVIKEPEVRDNVILQASQVLKPDGKAYFQVYSNKKKFLAHGPKQTGDNKWQEFRDISTYVPEIEKHFGNVVCKNGYIIASEPLESDVQSEWHLDGSGTNFRHLNIKR